MNEIHIPLKKIVAPEINQSGYANTLNETFNNIDYNFSTIANYDFIKGESGKSVKIDEVPFFDENGNETKYEVMLRNYFIEKYDEEQLKPITDNDGNEIHWYDNHINNSGILYLISNTENDTTETYIPLTSLYYVFLDGRYNNSKIGTLNDKTQFESIEDISCILIYDKNLNNGSGGFKSLDNAFPTIYYEQNAGFCWKINGNESGIPVQGIKGEDGKDSEIIYVFCDEYTESTDQYQSIKVTKIYDYPEKSLVNDEETEYSIDQLNEFNNKPALIFAKDQNTPKYKIFFGKLKYENDILTANFYKNTEILNNIETTNIINALKNISISSNNINALRGLFVPIFNEYIGNQLVQPAHIITSASIKNSLYKDDTDTERVDLMIAEINDINELRQNDENPFNVERYLYVQLDLSILKKYGKYSNIILNIINDAVLQNNNYILKYKLLNTYKVENLDNFEKTFKKFGKYKTNNDKEVILNEENVKYYTYNNPNQFTDISENTFSNKFKNDITSIGVYHWILCDEYNNFDDIIISSSSGGYKYPDEIKLYFNDIFTSSLNPIKGSEITWFNGLMADYLSTFYLSGWNPNFKLFNIKKFIPVFNNNNFKYDKESALNINYDVNITGNIDKNRNTHYTKNVNIHGDLNCNGINSKVISVDRLSTYGKLIVINDDIVVESGNLDVPRGSIFTNNIECNEIVTNNIECGEIVTNNIECDEIILNRTKEVAKLQYKPILNNITLDFNNDNKIIIKDLDIDDGNHTIYYMLLRDSTNKNVYKIYDENGITSGKTYETIFNYTSTGPNQLIYKNFDIHVICDIDFGALEDETNTLREFFNNIYGGIKVGTKTLVIQTQGQVEGGTGGDSNL